MTTFGHAPMTKRSWTSTIICLASAGIGYGIGRSSLTETQEKLAAADHVVQIADRVVSSGERIISALAMESPNPGYYFPNLSGSVELGSSKNALSLYGHGFLEGAGNFSSALHRYRECEAK